MNAFALNDVSLSYDSGFTLNSVSLILNEGELLSLVGGKSSGKTTLLKILTGFIQPSTGSAFVFNHSCNEFAEKLHKDCAVVFKESKLYGRLSALENMVFFAKLAGLSGQDAREYASDVMHSLNLWGIKDKPVAKLGHIQGCKLKIAAALVSKPKLLLLDEIENDMDDKSLLEIYDLLRDMVSNKGLTAVITSETGRHLDYADSFAIIDGGNLITSGKFKDVLSVSNTNPVAKIRTLDGKLASDEFTLNEDGSFTKIVENQEEMHKLIKALILAEDKLIEAQYIVPNLQDIANSLINREVEN